MDTEHQNLLNSQSSQEQHVSIEMTTKSPSQSSIRQTTSRISLQQHVNVWTAARKWWNVSKLWFTGAERRKARIYTLASVGFSILTTLLLLQISSVQGTFNSALSEKKESEFYSAVWGFVSIILVAAPLFAINEYIDSRISIEWRSWMARRLINLYLSNRAYFLLKLDPQVIDNPDQRITDDINSFTSSSVKLAVGVLRQVFYCVAFSGLLMQLAPGLVVFLIGYAVLGTFITAAVFGKPLTAMAFNVLQREADLRFDLVRVRENAESVAFYRADRREARIATDRLDTAVSVSRQQIALYAWLSLWQNIYSYATILIPSLLMAPRYFAGDVRFGTITQVSFAFNRIESALSYIVTNIGSLTSLAAETERLDALLGALTTTAMTSSSTRSSINKIESSDTKGLVVENLYLTTPHGKRILCRDLSIHVSPGQHVLIIGSSGAGKSSLMRAVAGLWKAGSGLVRTPLPSDTFFLPQKPYMPLGTLRQQLTFPDDSTSNSNTNDSIHGHTKGTTMTTRNNTSHGADGIVEINSNLITDGQWESLLQRACLPDLLTRVGGLDVECDWAHMLSLGEQQRVAFLRLLKRPVQLAFLDEATSGVDVATEQQLYQALRQICPCYISIGHRKELLNYHTHVLEALGDGRWSFSTVADYSNKHHQQQQHW